MRPIEPGEVRGIMTGGFELRGCFGGESRVFFRKVHAVVMCPRHIGRK